MTRGRFLRWLRRFARVGLLCIAWQLAAPGVRADSASEAELQFELGAELYKQGRYPEAIEHFIASNRLVANPNVVLNIAQTFAFMQRPADAYNWYETYLGFELAPDQRQRAEAARGELLSKVAVADISTSPSGAAVYLDREELGSVGTSPRKVAVSAGSHRVIAKLAGYADVQAELVAATGQVTKLDLTLSALNGGVDFDSVPSGALVVEEANQRELGRTPVHISTNVGEHRYAISLPNYLEQSREVRVEAGQTTLVKLRLAPDRSRLAVLTVTGNVANARVSLDGRPLGNAPLTLPDAPVGVRTMSIEAPAREPWQGKVPFEPGSATRVEYTLVDPDDRPWPGFRILGYGTGAALVAAGCVTGIVALSAHADFDKNPNRDDYDRTHQLNITTDVLLAAGVILLGTTLVWDLLRAPTPHSDGKVTLQH